MSVHTHDFRHESKPPNPASTGLASLGGDAETVSQEQETMDILKQYLERSAEIIGQRTPEEEKYDREVVRWLRKGKAIREAIAKANEKFPSEALQVDSDSLADVQAHYEYLAEHEQIMQKLNRLK